MLTASRLAILLLALPTLTDVEARWRGASPETAPAMQVPGPVTVLARSADGMFYADVMIEGTRIRCLVDTGATDVVLTPGDAARAGIPLAPARQTYQTMSGTGAMHRVTVAQMAIGADRLTDVAALVAERATLPTSLIGQSALARLGQIHIDGDRLTICPSCQSGASG